MLKLIMLVLLNMQHNPHALYNNNKTFIVYKCVVGNTTVYFNINKQTLLIKKITFKNKYNIAPRPNTKLLEKKLKVFNTLVFFYVDPYSKLVVRIITNR